MGFRVQLKYSPDPKQAITLFIGDTAEDVAPLLEPSTDSLRFVGDLAEELAVAFRDGTPVKVIAISRGTKRTVTDVLDAPDMAALSACQTELAALPETPLPPWPIRSVLTLTPARLSKPWPSPRITAPVG